MTSILEHTVELRRVFEAPRERVFAAWTQAQHLARWFGPSGFSTHSCEADPRAGGEFRLCMRSPEGVDYWVRGTFREVAAPERIVIDVRAFDEAGALALEEVIDVKFEEKADGSTLLDLRATAAGRNASAPKMLKGMDKGWAQTIDRLGSHIAQPHREQGMASVQHGTFTIERELPHSPARVFAAWADPKAKAKWFAGTPGQWTPIEREMDFRVGGRERLKGKWARGTLSDFQAQYFDIVPERRIVYGYAMFIDERKISVSLATIQLEPAKVGGKAGTRLVLTEQGAFLDGYDDAGSREHGTAGLIQSLALSLAE